MLDCTVMLTLSPTMSRCGVEGRLARDPGMTAPAGAPAGPGPPAGGVPDTGAPEKVGSEREGLFMGKGLPLVLDLLGVGIPISERLLGDGTVAFGVVDRAPELVLNFGVEAEGETIDFFSVDDRRNVMLGFFFGWTVDPNATSYAVPGYVSEL